MSSHLSTCPACPSQQVVKNGKIHDGNQNYQCQNCGHQFVQDTQYKMISSGSKCLIDKLLFEKLPLTEIARVAEVSEVWLQHHVNAKYAQVERQVKVSEKKGRLAIECDEAWSFVEHKGNQQWIWLTSRDTREIGVHVSKRSGTSARALWDSLPLVYCHYAVAYSDF